MFLHILENDRPLKLFAGCNLEGPGLVACDGRRDDIGSGKADHRRLGRSDDFEQRKRGRRDRGADDRIDFFLVDQLSSGFHRRRRIARVIKEDITDRLATDRRRQKLDRVFDGDAERSGRTGQRHDDADLDLRLRGR